MPESRAGLDVAAAARQLGVSPATLHRWVLGGCPVVQRGRRGRGCPLLIDPAAVREWRASCSGKLAGTERTDLLALAARIPDLLAAAVDQAFRQTDGPHKAALAAPMALAWYQACSAVLDELRERDPSVPELRHVPASIARLQKITR